MMVTVHEVMTTSFTVLSSDWTVARAHQVLQGASAHWIVVRRDDTPDARFHIVEIAKIWRLPARSVGVSLLRVLDLPKYPRAAVLAPTQPATDIPLQPAVVLDSAGELLGVALPAALRSITPATDPPFVAYPRLDGPVQVAPQEAVTFTIGFRVDQDASLARGHAPLVFDGATSDDTCLVLLQGDGVMLATSQVILPLTLDAPVEVAATVIRATGVVSIRADYYFRTVLVGQAERLIPVGVAPPLEDSPPIALAPPDPAAALDLLLTARRTQEGQLLWTAMPGDPALAPVVNAPSAARWDLEAARRFATMVMDEAEDMLADATDVLVSIGREIAELIPMAIWELCATLASRQPAPLRILLKTDEPFIPWELAVSPLGGAVAADGPGAAPPLPFWAARSAFGRWIDRPSVRPLPPATQTIARITAVAAGYGDAESALPALRAAVAEQEMLVARWQAVALLAKRKDLETILLGAPVAGHLLHVAAHGESIPLNDEQALLLADRTALSPRKLMMSPDPQTQPRFAVVVLNACQVGVPGTSLGQISGFPGEVLRGGASGVLAPLWSVGDTEAAAFATLLYEALFQEQATVGEVLQRYRTTHERFRLPTRLAYVWYGHPGLRLQHTPAAAPTT